MKQIILILSIQLITSCSKETLPLNGKGYFAQNTLFLRLNNSSAVNKFIRYDTR